MGALGLVDRSTEARDRSTPPPGHRRMRLIRLLSAAVLLGAVLATGELAAASGTAEAATSVSNVSVSVSPPSTAAGATTDYTVGFEVSSTGGMTPAASSTVTLSMPSTTVEEYGTVYDGTTEVGYCDPSSSGTVTCPMVYGPVNAGTPWW